jgi:hypothetical protein
VKKKISKEELKQKILETIRKRKEGIRRKDLWKTSKIKSEIGTKALLELIKNGKIIQTEEYIDGKKVQYLRLPMKKLKMIPIESVKDLPCIPCNDYGFCSEMGNLTPINCKKLDEWLEYS